MNPDTQANRPTPPPEAEPAEGGAAAEREAEDTAASGPGATGAEGEAEGGVGAGALAEVPEGLLAGYLDAALATLRAADQADLPGPLRQYQSWTPKRLRHPRVLALVRRTLDLDQSFRKAVDERVLEEEDALARLLRAGRHVEALASGEPPEVVAKVGLALGPAGETAVQAAAAASATGQARAEAAAARSALAGVESELGSARERADAEAAAARAARDELRAAKDELRRVERERRGLADRVEGLERELARAAAALRAARDETAAEQRRLGGRITELQARLTEAQRKYRALRRSAGQVDPVVAEAVGALERDLDALRRATGVAGDNGGRGTAAAAAGAAPGGVGAARQPERRTPLTVPGGRGADDPETLAAWMGVDRVLVLVDGYNVTKHPQGFADRGLEDQRTLLVDLCRRLARRSGAEVTVVFDGGTVGPIPTRLSMGPVEVVFTDPGRSADDEIVARANAAPPERPVVVVTSDNELRDRVSTLGATVTRSPSLLGLAAAR